MPIKITIQPSRSLFDPTTNRFIDLDLSKPLVLTLEHSLIAVSKWESKWKVPFLTLGQDFKGEKLIDYIRFMTVTPTAVDPNVYYALSRENLERIIKYIDDPMSATTIKDIPGQRRGNSHITVVTSEVIYYWMAALRIPFTCEKWHLNRLMTLIKIASIEQEPPKKMSKGAAMDQQRALMAARRAKSHR